jgi:hypothetical protein
MKKFFGDNQGGCFPDFGLETSTLADCFSSEDALATVVPLGRHSKIKKIKVFYFNTCSRNNVTRIMFC